MAQFIYDSENLPEPLVRALKRAVFDYSIARRKFLDQFTGQYDEEFSATDLSQSIKQLWLKRKFRKDIVVDLVRDNYHALLGSVIHHILEHHAPPRCIVEERLHTFLTINGVRVLLHAQPDLYDPDKLILDDWKFTSATAILYEKEEYRLQLNIGKYPSEGMGREVKRIRNIYLFRYLDQRLMQQNPDYPRENVYIKEHTPWTRQETESRIKAEISRLLKHRKTKWKELPDCTDDERWIRNTTYAIIKRVKGTKKAPIGHWGKNAYAVADTEKELIQLLKNNPVEEETKIVKRAGMPRKCMDYCPVSGWCHQYQSELKENEKHILTD
jgi:hypothetical protein